MNAQRKKSAVMKYTASVEGGITTEELTNLLAQDEKNYTADEINEIRQALLAPAPAPITGTKKAEVKANNGDWPEEWRCEIKLTTVDGKVTDRKAEKVKLKRTCVKISEQEAATLNNGALNTPRTDFVLMYFKPGEDEPIS